MVHTLPLLSIEEFFYRIFFYISDLLYVSHDQDFKLNFSSSQLKSAWILSALWWKFSKSQTGKIPIINEEKKLLSGSIWTWSWTWIVQMTSAFDMSNSSDSYSSDSSLLTYTGARDLKFSPDTD